MKKVLRFRVASSAVFLLCVATAIAAPSQTFTTLVSFNGTDGIFPYAPLAQGTDGNLYGTATQGGANGQGTVFKVTPTGTLTLLHSFDSTDGALPEAGLVLGSDGNFYGATLYGGVVTTFPCSNPGCGTIFKITPSGTLTTLHSFDYYTDGDYPNALVQASDGAFYGTTRGGGASGLGTVFRITSGGTLATLYNFCAQTNCTDGAGPNSALVQATDGNFYGTTEVGGTNSIGTVFKITPTGILTTLHSFDSTDGADPFAALAQATDGNLYGTTNYGGASNYGTVFKITPGGTLTTLHSFDLTDGDGPNGTLVRATDGNLYGTTIAGGSSDDFGTAFKITTGGTFTTLHTFDSPDGLYTYAGLVQATNGTFYGTAFYGGVSNYGTVFSLSTGLSPFVETLPAVGKAGTPVIILGNNLTGTTSVTFNGTAATFTIVSTTEIKTTVPTGATSGKVQVTTPHGTLTSNVVFRVKE